MSYGHQHFYGDKAAPEQEPRPPYVFTNDHVKQRDPCHDAPAAPHIKLNKPFNFGLPPMASPHVETHGGKFLRLLKAYRLQSWAAAEQTSSLIKQWNNVMRYDRRISKSEAREAVRVLNGLKDLINNPYSASWRKH